MFWRHGLLLVTFCALTINGWSVIKDRNQYERKDELYNNNAYQRADALFKDIENIINDNFLKRERQQETSITEEELNKNLKDLPANDELFEGDMVMDNRLRDAVMGVKKSVISQKYIKWPNNTIVYEVDPDFKGWRLLHKAIKEFEARTCIRFKKRTNEKDYVLYSSKKDMCSSYIGKVGGVQKIHIGIHCMVLGTVLHETMHALGFIHEHSRPDRDNYIKVKWNNIEKKEWSNFNKYSFSDVNNEGVKYNFASVMHYRNDAFTKNGGDTLVPLEEDYFKFGQRVKFSIGDVKGINQFYGCSKNLKNPKYGGLYEDYSGARDARLKRNKLRNVMRQHFFDRQNKRNQPSYYRKGLIQ